MDLKQLVEPFPPSDIEWRVSRSGIKNDKVWATVVAYLTNRAIMERLDEVCGPANWRNEYRPWDLGSPGVLCGIAIKIGDEWVTKWDGAEQPAEKGGMQLVAVKGGFSNAMKRAAVLWGIGRYLYDLPEGYATIEENGRHYQPASKKTGKEVPAFKWNAPALPKWALPESHKVA
jgi:hypothetical protein